MAKAGDAVKTTVRLPRDVWRAAKDRALDERESFETIVIRALEAFLKTKPSARRGGAR